MYTRSTESSLSIYLSMEAQLACVIVIKVILEQIYGGHFSFYFIFCFGCSDSKLTILPRPTIETSHSPNSYFWQSRPADFKTHVRLMYNFLNSYSY